MLHEELTTTRILSVFVETVANRRGEVTHTYDDGWRLFTRSVLPLAEDVRPGDRLQGGVALKATDEGIWLYPYLFRLICQNGAIVPHTLEARHLEGLHLRGLDGMLREIRQGIEACCGAEVFRDSVGKVRSACEIEADAALKSLALYPQIAPGWPDHLLSNIRDRFFREGDRSRFGFANAVTATARDMQEPALKWELEKLGGRIAVGATLLQLAEEDETAVAYAS